ncbi:MAG: hypothetical protein H0V27_10690 [Pyrinomonadaceae bacterium]|jgi:hypothetical protein|nr:hypothetical protein [Pyrinomonadaceae bacterium]
MTNEEHNKYLGISFLVHGGFQLLIMLAMLLMFYFFFSSMPGQPGQPGPAPGFFLLMFGFMSAFQLAFTAPSFVAGYALLKRKPWSKVARIVGAVLAGMNFPIEAAVCVYALWFNLGRRVEGTLRGRGERPNQHERVTARC